MATATLKLNAGANIPAIGFGTWQLAEGAEAKDSVASALQAGYRLIDTAKIYNNEKSVGQAIKASKLKRQDIFVTTKLWNSDQGYDRALAAFDQSLRKLELGYLDLYLIHWPNSSSRLEAWRALGEIYQQGRARAVGVSNFMVEHLEELLSQSKLVPAVNQIEFHPFIYQQQKPVLDFCKKHGIIVEAYSPLARSRQFDNATIDKIAGVHKKSSAQVMLRWAIQHGTVPIPKSATPERIRENLDVFDFKLSESEMDSLNLLSSGKSSMPFYIRAWRR